MVNYKFNEGALIQELQDYIDSTYDQHYSKDKFQSSEFIIDCGHGMGFFLGNVLKYTQRYGKKDGANRKDIMKILHYALLALHQHDLDNEEELQLDLDLDDLTIDLSNTDSISLSTMYNDDNMYYNSMDSITVDLDSNVTTLTYGNSIDDATPEEWNQASKKAYKGKTKK
jgi:hypothetical protein